MKLKDVISLYCTKEINVTECIKHAMPMIQNSEQKEQLHVFITQCCDDIDRMRKKIKETMNLLDY